MGSVECTMVLGCALQWPSFHPRYERWYYRSHTFDRAYPRCVICQENQVLL